MNNTLDTNWIAHLWEWRLIVSEKPTPFVIPNYLDAIYYLRQETDELFAACHKSEIEKRAKHLRNPDSKRKNVEGEVGDVLLMLGTVAILSGYSYLRNTNSIVPSIVTDRVGSARKLASLTDELAHNWESDVLSRTSIATGRTLDQIYSMLMSLCESYEIDPGAALTQTLKKIEERDTNRQVTIFSYTYQGKPPSSNNAYFNVPGQGRVLKKDEREWKQKVYNHVFSMINEEEIDITEHIGKPLGIELIFHLRNRFGQDWDGLVKLTQDATMEALGINDKLIVKANVHKIESDNPHFSVKIWTEE